MYQFLSSAFLLVWLSATAFGNTYNCLFSDGPKARESCAEALKLPNLSNVQRVILERAWSKHLFEAKNYIETTRQLKAIIGSGLGLPEDQELLASSLWWEGKTVEAEAEMLKAKQQQPDNIWLEYEYGRLLNENKKHDAALETFEGLIGRNPNQADFKHMRGITLLWLEQNVLAAEALGEAARLAKTDASIWADYAYVQVELQRLPEALESYNAAIRANPLNADFYVKRAKLKQDMRQPKDAIYDYSRAIELDADQWTYYDRAHAHAANGNYAAARRDIVDGGKVGLSVAYQKVLEGRILYNEGKPEASLTVLNEALAADPEAAAAQYWRAQINIESDKFEDAIVDLKKTVEVWPTDAVSWSDLAYAQYSLADYEDALRSIAKSIRYAPKDPGNHELKSRILVAIGSFDEALTVASKAVELEPNRAWAHFRKAEAARRGSDLKIAREAINAFIAREPDLPWGYLERARINITFREYDTVLSDIDRAKKVKPGITDPDYVLAWFFEDTNKPKEAEEVYANLIKVAKDDPWPHYHRAWILLGADRPALGLQECEQAKAKAINQFYAARCKAFMLERMNKVRDARELIADAASKTQLRGFAAFDLGYLNYRMGDYDAAIASYSSAIEHKYLATRALINRGDAYFALGQKNEALSDYENALRHADQSTSKQIVERLSHLSSTKASKQGFEDAYPQNWR
jgi:tetratricopeptide (TPR) repeat protein